MNSNNDFEQCEQAIINELCPSNLDREILSDMVIIGGFYYEGYYREGQSCNVEQWVADMLADLADLPGIEGYIETVWIIVNRVMAEFLWQEYKNASDSCLCSRTALSKTKMHELNSPCKIPTDDDRGERHVQM